jgi:uncharacterized membrane protein
MVAVELLAACIWVGSLVCLALVTSAARKVLDAASQVALFRAIGRRYGIVGTAALLVAIGCGLALAWPPSTWSNTIDAAVALSGVLVLFTAAGMAHARAMTALRRHAVTAPDDRATTDAVRRGRLLAGALRASMALATLAVLVLAAQAITH